MSGEPVPGGEAPTGVPARTPPWKRLLAGLGAGALLGLGYSFASQALGST